MSNPEQQKQHEQPAEAPEAESQRGTGTMGFGVSAITRRWKREDLLKRGSLGLTGFALLFSLLALIITASNKHGPGLNFDQFEEYRYLLAIAVLSTLYAGGQALRHVHEISTGKQMLDRRNSALLDFFGDQIMAYLLISAASSAIPLTNRLRENADNIFTDSSAAGISMAFFAFFSLGLSALISGYKLSTQSYM